MIIMAMNKTQVKHKMGCLFDQRDDCMEAGGSAMHGAIAEKSLHIAGIKVSTFVEMTYARYF